MKKIILSFLMLLNLSVVSQGTWSRADFPSEVNLTALYFTDSITGWVAGDSGMIWRTGNGGDSWSLQQSGTTNEIVSLFFLNQDEGWATSFNYTQPPYGTLLLHTTNGGSTWQQIPFSQPEVFISCLWFFDPMNGWAGGSPHALMKTTDGGASWQQAVIDTSTLAFFPVENIQFYNQQYGYASGGIFDVAGVIWRTSNGGDLWYAIDPSEAPADEVHGLHLFDSTHVIGAGGDPDFGYGVGMIRTTNGGINWEYEELGMQGTALDLDFRNASEAWAPLGARRTLIFSSDTGATWTEMATPDSAIINRLTFPDSLHGYGVGAGGTVIRYRPPVIGIRPSDEQMTIKIFPNPASGNVTLSFSGRGKFSRIELVDMMGKTVLERNPDAGEKQITLDISLLPAGIYLVKTNEGATGKLLLEFP